MIFKDLQKYNNKLLLTLIKIRILLFFPVGEWGSTVVGNGVVVLGGEHLIMMLKLRRLR